MITFLQKTGTSFKTCLTRYNSIADLNYLLVSIKYHIVSALGTGIN